MPLYTKEQCKEAIEAFPLFFMEMNPVQEKFIRCKTSRGATPKRRLLEMGNKGGKTLIGVAEDIAHAIGYRPWLHEGDPDYKVDIKVPNSGLIGSETIQHSIAEKIEPLLRKLVPRTCMPIWKPGPTGVLARVTFKENGKGDKCGSVIHLRSYDGRPDTYEGIDYDFEHWDEPPPEPHFKAAERGKISSNAASWFTMTPLKEPYIFDILSSKAPYDEEIAVIRGEIWDNCMDWCQQCDLDISENQNGERVIGKCPSCNKIMGFMTKFGINEYLKTLDPEEREAREKGVWKHLSGLVYKELDADIHQYEDFSIPKSWMKVESVDPHDAKPTRWIFGAISPEEIEIFGKVRHRIFFYDYLLLTGSIDGYVKKVKSVRALHGYEEPVYVMLDKKYGLRTQMEGRSWQDELEKHGIRRIKLSQSDPGDVDIGHKIVREYIKPQYSVLAGKVKPGILFAKKGCTGQNSPWHDMSRYQWKEGSEKPEDIYKDFPDTIRYLLMEQPRYRSPEDENKIVELITARKDQVYNSRRTILNAVG